MAYKSKEKAFEYNNAYNIANYDRITIMPPKGTREKLKRIAAERGVSVNALILSALREKYGI